MPHMIQRARAVCLIVLVLVMPGMASAEEKIINLEFARPDASGSDTSRTLQSLVKIQGTGQFLEDGLYLMTHYGDREELFARENQRAMDFPLLEQTWRHCSVFTSSTRQSAIVGRNWDNQNVGSIIVSLYFPSDGYASISFCRSIDLGFGHKDLDGIEESMFGHKLLAAPFHAMDGINEHGLSVSVAGVRPVALDPKPGSRLVYVPFLVRKILDGAKNIEEAVSLARQYVPFDIDENALNSHYMIADASGRSVILEYTDNQWRVIYGDGSFQILTNKPVYDVPDTVLREQCRRYAGLSKALEDAGGGVDWRAGMKMLRDAAQKGTTWSVVYSGADIYFSVYQNWDTIYHIGGF